MDANLSFQQMNDELLKFVLDTRFFNVWRKHDKSEDSAWGMSNVELFVTGDCNLDCKYCYLSPYGEKLYPHKYRSKELILKNMRILFDWFLEEKFEIPAFDLFSGEIWHTSFGFEVLGVIQEYIEKGMKVYTITIPTNCTFILDDESTAKMQGYIDSFGRLGTRIIISCSVEGKVLEEVTRPFRNEAKKNSRDESYYDKLFTFCRKNQYYFHPMVSAENVKHWIANLDWYLEKLQDYGFPDNAVMMLEVRNDNWTDESLDDLIKYYDYEIMRKFRLCGSDPKAFGDHLLGKNRESNSNSGYYNYALPLADEHAGCTIPSTLTVRLGDLALPPCHRTAYDQFVYGKFNVEDGKITGITSNNPQTAIKILYTNNKISHHGCDTCPYVDMCLRGCYGAQYEYGEEIFMPVPGVCKMLKTKYDFLIRKYDELGVIEYFRSIKPSDVYYELVQKMLKACDRVRKTWRAK